MTRQQPTPAELLAAAHLTATRADTWGSSWSRATAVLTRQALEDALRSLWSGPTAGLDTCTVTAQLTCLPYYLRDSDVAHRTRHTWPALSNACHARPYELSPTTGEIHAWISDVHALLASLEDQSEPDGENHT